MVSVVSSKSVFRFPEPGKPDPHWDPTSNMPRRRVVDHGQKASTCSYYAMQLLRNNRRIGKHPPEHLNEQRKMEEALSQNRKQMTKTDHDLLWRISFACQLTRSLSNSCTREKAQAILKDPSSIGKEHQAKCCAALKEFCEQDKYDEFVVFAKETYFRALMEVEGKLLRGTFKLTRDDIANSVPEKVGKVWAKMTTEEKHGHVRDLVFHHSYRAYGCKESPWHPELPLEMLIKEIELFGPHLIQGYFGQCYYQDDPKPLKDKIEGRTVFAWKPDSKRKDVIETHCILVVGADAEKKLVYYIDPHDGSKPGDVTTQKVYAMSDKRLRSSITSLSGLSWKIQDTLEPIFEPRQIGRNNYALYI
jgi:hypothetical protein